MRASPKSNAIYQTRLYFPSSSARPLPSSVYRPTFSPYDGLLLQQVRDPKLWPTAPRRRPASVQEKEIRTPNSTISFWRSQYPAQITAQLICDLRATAIPHLSGHHMECAPSVAGGVPSPVTPRSPVSSRRGDKRKRGSFVDHESSPGSDNLDEKYEEKYADTLKKRQPGVKRACNECRQQKVSHSAMHGTTGCPGLSSTSTPTTLRDLPRCCWTPKKLLSITSSTANAIK